MTKIANKRAEKSELKAQGILNLYRSDKTEPILKETLVDDVWGIGYPASSRSVLIGQKIDYFR